MPIKNQLLAIAAAIHLSGCVGAGFSMNGPVSFRPTYLPPGARSPTPPPEQAGRLNDDGSVTYVLKDERDWCGLTVFVVVPVPLWLPVCRIHEDATYQDGIQIHTSRQSPVTYFMGCGPLVPMMGWGRGERGEPGFCRADLPR